MLTHRIFALSLALTFLSARGTYADVGLFCTERPASRFRRD